MKEFTIRVIADWRGHAAFNIFAETPEQAVDALAASGLILHEDFNFDGEVHSHQIESIKVGDEVIGGMQVLPGFQTEYDRGMQNGLDMGKEAFERVRHLARELSEAKSAASLYRMTMHRLTMAMTSIDSKHVPPSVFAVLEQAIKDTETTHIIALDTRERDTVLAALRFWQREGRDSHLPEYAIATDSGPNTELGPEEIDALIENKVNV